MVYMLPSFDLYIYFFCDTRLNFLYSSGLSLSIVYYFVVSTVSLVLLLCTLCIYFCISKSVFTCHSECLWFLLRKWIWNLTAVPPGYYFTCFGGIFSAKYVDCYFTYQGFSYSTLACIYLVHVVSYYQALYQIIILAFLAVSSEYGRFLFKLSGLSIYISLECWWHLTFY